MIEISRRQMWYNRNRPSLVNAPAIANSPLSKNKDAAHHYSEAEAIALMNRPELSAQEILLDELAARQIAHARGIHVVGFAGILIRACQQRLLVADDVRDALMLCQQQGTHYSDRFITEIYQRLTEG
jgi:predicted nucleic acid-binding protein